MKISAAYGRAGANLPPERSIRLRDELLRDEFGELRGLFSFPNETKLRAGECLYVLNLFDEHHHHVIT